MDSLWQMYMYKIEILQVCPALHLIISCPVLWTSKRTKVSPFSDVYSYAKSFLTNTKECKASKLNYGIMSFFECTLKYCGQLVYTLCKSSRFTKSLAVKKKAKRVRGSQNVKPLNWRTGECWQHLLKARHKKSCFSQCKHRQLRPDAHRLCSPNKKRGVWKEENSQHFEIRVEDDALSQEGEWCPVFLHLTLLSIEA